MAAPVYIGPVITPQTPTWSPTSPASGGGGVYDALFGGMVPDLSTLDLGLGGNTDVTPENLIIDAIGDLAASVREAVVAGTMTAAEAAQIVQDAWRSVGATDPKGNPVVVDANSIDASDPRYGIEYAEGGQIRLPQLTQSNAAASAAASAAAQGAISDAVSSVMGQQTAGGVSASNASGGGAVTGDIGTASAAPSAEQQWQEVLDSPNFNIATAVNEAIRIYGNSPAGVAAVVNAANSAGVSAQEVANVSGFELPALLEAATASGVSFVNNVPETIVSLDPDGDLFGTNTGLGNSTDALGSTVGTGVSGNEGVGTGVGLLGGVAGTNPDGTPIQEGTGPVTTQTPQEQWQQIVNDPNVDVAGAVAAAQLIFGNTAEGVIAVADAANKAGVSAQEVAESSDFSVADLITAAASVGVPFLLDKKTTTTNTSTAATTNTVGATGATGAAGVAGVAGATGAIGPIGATGAAGAAGRDGATGAVGAIGPQGIPGAIGSIGPIGATGVAGATGAAGAAGAQGERGLQGLQGERGLQGVAGATGAAGAAGAKGDTGAAGAAGATGATGAQGVAGATGAQGVQGIQGVKGDRGEQGLMGLAGAKGDTGAAGATGATGAAGAAGAKGDTGAAGAAGAKGDKGDRGDRGEQGLMGLMGLTGATGAAGAAGAAGATGAQGAQGIQGVQGIQGERGPAPIVNSIFAPELFKSSATLGPEVNTLFGAFRRSQMQ